MANGKNEGNKIISPDSVSNSVKYRGLGGFGTRIGKLSFRNIYYQLFVNETNFEIRFALFPVLVIPLLFPLTYIAVTPGAIFNL